MSTPDPGPSATLEHIRVGAESEITHPDDECGIAAGGFCTPHGALVLVAALEAVLKLADALTAPAVAADCLDEELIKVRRECATRFREAITRELNGDADA